MAGVAAALDDPSAEPRMQINDTMQSQIVFGTTVDGSAPGQRYHHRASGYPIRSLRKVPAGDYYVQAVLNSTRPSTGRTARQ